MRNVPQPSYVPRAPPRRPRPNGVHWVAGLLALLVASTNHTAPQPGKDPLAGQPDFLPVNDAFVVSARRSARQVVLRWDMPDGYYLYRHAFSVQADEGRFGTPVIPAGKPKVDQYFGASEVYYGQVEMTVPMQNSATQSARLHVTYQGCADYGLCYPPQRRLIALGPDGSLKIATSPANAGSDVR